MLTNQLIL